MTTGLSHQRQAPYDFPGTSPEYAVYRALETLQERGEISDFQFQSPAMGGRATRGGAVLDFYVPELRLGINVQSVYWHYGKPANLRYDRLQRTALEGSGIKVVYIDEADAMSDALYYVREALRGIDHSRMARRV